MQCHYCDREAAYAAEKDHIKVGLCERHFRQARRSWKAPTARRPRRGTRGGRNASDRQRCNRRIFITLGRPDSRSTARRTVVVRSISTLTPSKREWGRRGQAGARRSTRHRRYRVESLRTGTRRVLRLRVSPPSGPGGSVLVQSGTATFESADGDVRVGAGEAIRFAPGEWQRGHNEGDERVGACARRTAGDG